VLTAVTLVLVAGCTSGSSKPTSSTSNSKVGSGSVSATPTIVYTPASSLPPAGGNVVAKYRQVTAGKCEAISGGWQLSGTVTNSTSATDTYDILVYFTDDHATVLDSASVSVTAAAGATESFTASKKFTTPPTMRCVIVSVK
jgi:hypothetical protein